MFLLLVEIPAIIAIAFYKAFLTVQGKPFRNPEGAAIWPFRIIGFLAVLGCLIAFVVIGAAGGAWWEFAKTAGSLVVMATIGVVLWARFGGG